MKTLSHIKTVSGLKLVGNEQIVFYFVEPKFNKNNYTLWWGLSNKKICTCEIEFILKLVNFKEKITTKTMFIKYKNKTFLRIPVCCYCFGGHTNIFLFFLLPASTFIGYRYQNAETTNMSNKTSRKWRRSQTVRVSKSVTQVLGWT